LASRSGTLDPAALSSAAAPATELPIWAVETNWLPDLHKQIRRELIRLWCEGQV
jgi:hypothetical protein